MYCNEENCLNCNCIELSANYHLPVHLLLINIPWTIYGMEIVHTTCVKLGKNLKSVRQLQSRFYIHTFVSGHTLITIAQSISCIFLLIFAAISRKLLHSFVFKKLTSYDVTIPGSDSKISWKLDTYLPNIHTKLKLYGCSETVFFLTD